MEQVYKNYTDEDHQVWKTLFNRQIVNLSNVVTEDFLTGLGRIKFRNEVIPHFENTNVLLKELTGWSIKAVPGIVDDDLFFKLLAERKFPATTWIRKMSELDYLEEPDMFHDVFGHVPLLTNQKFAEFLQALGEIGTAFIDDEWAIELLSRVYWFTVEFGLIRERENLRIYGAGILSSAGETKYSLGPEPECWEYNVGAVLDSSYRKDVFQTRYFVIQSYDQLYQSIPEIQSVLAQRAGKVRS